MKKLRLLLLLTTVVLSASAQKVYFVYLQAEPEQPFFVKMNQKTQWSSSAGYLILSRLYDSTYSFSVGFPKNKFPEQNFVVNINKKDHGFLLKNFEDKGWGLYDLQTLELQMAVNASNDKPAGNTSNVTPFTEILAKAADDPSLKQNNPSPKKPEPKTEVVTEPIKDTTAIVAVASNTTPENETEQPVSKKSKKKKQKETETVSNEKQGTSDPVVNKETEKTAVTETKTEAPNESKETAVVPTENKELKTENKTETQAPTEEKKEMKTETRDEIKEPVTGQKDLQGVTNNPEKYKASEVKKYSETSTTEGFGLVYIDNYQNGSKDTIRLVIPNPTPVVAPVKDVPKEEKKFLEIGNEAGNKETVSTESANNEVKMEKPKSSKGKKKDSKNNEVKNAEAENSNVRKEEEKNTQVPAKEVTEEVKNDNTTTAPIKTVEQPTGFSNSCTDLATEDDFVRLRKKMAGEKEDKMVAEAKKIFKLKCFSTNQVRVLGRLFETDEERYNFFDYTYKHVHNPEAFSSLQSEFQDPYYSGRFKAMLRN